MRLPKAHWCASQINGGSLHGSFSPIKLGRKTRWWLQSDLFYYVLFSSNSLEMKAEFLDGCAPTIYFCWDRDDFKFLDSS